jgi:hypothetical protein
VAYLSEIESIEEGRDFSLMASALSLSPYSPQCVVVLALQWILFP